MEIKAADLEDAKPVKELLSENQLIFEDLTASHFKHFFVLLDNATLAGVIGLEILGRFALLRSLAIKPAYRNKGWATQLLAAAENHAATRNVNILYLLTTTADGFFEKCGYERTDRNGAPAAVQETAEFKSLCPSSAVCMVKRLGSSSSHEKDDIL